MKTNLKKLIVTLAAAAMLAPALHAQSVSLVTVGGNASIKLITNRIPTILSSAVYTQGNTSLPDYLDAQLEYNATVKQYLDTAVRHRRSMLSLNTVVGRRVMP